MNGTYRKYVDGVLVCAKHNKPIQKQTGELGLLFCPACQLEHEQTKCGIECIGCINNNRGTCKVGGCGI